MAEPFTNYEKQLLEGQTMFCDYNTVMLIIDLGLEAKFCGIGLGFGTVALALALEVWPWQKIQGQNLVGLQNSPLTSVDSSTTVNFMCNC